MLNLVFYVFTGNKVNSDVNFNSPNIFDQLSYAFKIG